MTKQTRIAAFPWYKREDYDELLHLFADAVSLPKTYEHWLELAENGVNSLRSKGLTVEKVYIDPKTFPSWCAARSLNVDSKARIRFANETAARKYLKPD
jgi:hypothetical protein